MTNLVRHVPDDRILNLSALSPADFQLIASLHGEITRETLVLECLSTGGDPALLVYRAQDGRYWARHFPGAGHGSHEVVPESDEHRRQKDYHVRAAEAAGFTAETEFSTGKTKLDVRVGGGAIDTGFEIQHSVTSAAKAKQRTTKSWRAGYMVAWFSDKGAPPSFLREVPAYGCNALPWQERLPGARSATATGLVHVNAVRCVIGAFQQCPEGNFRPCGKFHPDPEPWRGLTVDDVVAKIPAGLIVPLSSRRGVLLTCPDDLARYQELTGGQGIWVPGSRPSMPQVEYRPPAHCANPEHSPEPSDNDKQIDGFMLNPPALEDEPVTQQITLPWAAKSLGHYAGRCKFCGWHIQTQGHSTKCGTWVH